MFAVVAAVASAGVATPLGWVHHHSTFVPPTTPISFSICIKSANPMDHLFTAALEVSTPGLPRYGKFLTVEEIERLTAPSPADVNAVTAWLRSHDIGFTRNKECLLAEATVGKATDLLQTGFHLFPFCISFVYGVWQSSFPSSWLIFSRNNANASVAG